MQMQEIKVGNLVVVYQDNQERWLPKESEEYQTIEIVRELQR